MGPAALQLLLEILPRVLEVDGQVSIHLVRAIGHFKYRKDSQSLWLPATKNLESLLQHPSPALRGAVALTLAELEESSPAFVDRLEMMCRSAHLEERRNALMALRHVTDSNAALGPRTQHVFLDALSEPDEKVKEAVEWALRDLGPAILPELLARMNDRNALVRANVLATLAQFDTEHLAERQKRRIAQGICDALCDDDKDVRRAAAYASALEHFAQNYDEPRDWRRWLAKCADEIGAIFQPSWRTLEELTIQRLLSLCVAGDPCERESSLHALGNIGDHRTGRQFSAGEAVVAENLKHPSETVRAYAHRAYRHFAVAPANLVSICIQGITDPSCHVAEDATRSLLELAKGGVDVSRAIPELCRLLDRRECDSYGGVYSPFEDACEILMLIRVDHVQPAIEPLTRALESKAPRVVAKAAEALWKIDQRVTESLPRLRELLDSGELHAETFCDTVYRIGPAAAPLAADVIRLLADRSWDTQWAAADALGAIASSDPGCIRSLIEALTHPSGIVRNAAIQALSNIGDESVPLLVSTLRGDDDEAKEMAADALGVIGDDAQAAVPELRRLLTSKSEGVRDWSAIALGKIMGSEETVPALLEILKRRDGPNIRVQTAQALGRIGPPARAAIPLLQSIIDEFDGDSRSVVEEAVNRIQG